MVRAPRPQMRNATRETATSSLPRPHWATLLSASSCSRVTARRRHREDPVPRGTHSSGSRDARAQGEGAKTRHEGPNGVGSGEILFGGFQGGVEEGQGQRATLLQDLRVHPALSRCWVRRPGPEGQQRAACRPPWPSPGLPLRPVPPCLSAGKDSTCTPALSAPTGPAWGLRAAEGRHV